MTRFIPAELKNLYSQGRLIPFVGSGISKEVSWREGDEVKSGASWRELVDQAARMLGFEDPELLRMRGSPLEILEYFGIINDGQFAKLTNWLSINMRPDDKVLLESPIYHRFALLERCPVFYTTNYDDFIERALALHGRASIPVVIEAHFALSRTVKVDQPVEIVKFHGDLNYPDHMVISQSDYQRRLNLSTAMDYRLRADILARAVLFLGYSFSDWNVSYLFRLVNEQFSQLPGSSSGRRAYIVLPDPSDFEIKLFRARNIEVIPVNSRNRTSEIVDILDEIRS